MLLSLMRGKERVIDAGGQPDADAGPAKADASNTDSAPAGDDATAEADGPGEILEARGKDDAECGLADWIMLDVNTALDGDYNSDRAVINRVADAALKASADLKATGSATVDLPYILADASGPKHYRRTFTRAEAEPGMVAEGVLLVDELLQWRGRDERTVALAGWLESESDEEGTGSLDPPSTVRMADATEAAIADLTRTGRAVVDLRGLTRDRGGPRDFRREIDRAKLDEIVGED
ncbi:MAG TPA: Hsp70 family protein [Vineibacter sp.]|nr:Hsp70 family protein [Vineibacter sp.]